MTKKKTPSTVPSFKPLPRTKKQSKRVLIVLNENLLEEVDKLAENYKTSRSDMIAQCIAFAINHLETKEDK